MASNLSPKQQTASEKDTFRQLVGVPSGVQKYTLRTGAEKAAQPSACNIMTFGEFGTGKTYMVIGMLKLGLKVLYLNTDFGRSGYNSIRNYFKDHPEEAHLQENLALPEDEKGRPLDIKAVLAFCVNPEAILPWIYDFDPDMIFWDGLTSFQQGDLEDMITGGDILREDTTWKDWRSALNGTIFPLMKFLGQHNERTNKPWHKCVTLLQSVKGKFKSGPVGAGQDRELIPGSEKTGPMLHTGARELAGAGFDIVLQTVVENRGKDRTFKYFSRGDQLLTKDRGYSLPAEMTGNFVEVWGKYIQPKVTGVVTVEAVQ